MRVLWDSLPGDARLRSEEPHSAGEHVAADTHGPLGSTPSAGPSRQPPNHDLRRDLAGRQRPRRASRQRPTLCPRSQSSWEDRPHASAAHPAERRPRQAGRRFETARRLPRARVLLAKERPRRRQRPSWTRWLGWLQDGLARVGTCTRPGHPATFRRVHWRVVSFQQAPPSACRSGSAPGFQYRLYTLDVLIPAPALAQTYVRGLPSSLKPVFSLRLHSPTFTTDALAGGCPAAHRQSPLA